MSDSNNTESAIKEFNDALRCAVIKKYNELKDAQIRMLDVKKAQDVELKIKENVLIYAESEEKETDNNFINYYWIDYHFVDGEAQKRTTFFYKDIDTKTRNVHIIPGVIQEWELNPKEKFDMPILIANEDNIKIINVMTKGCYFPFVEEGWCPVYSQNNAIVELVDKNHKIGKYEEYRDNMRSATLSCRKTVFDMLKNENLLYCNGEANNYLVEGRGRYKKYEFIAWITRIQSRNSEKNHIVNMYDLVYFKGLGLFTVYNYLSFITTNGESNEPNSWEDDEKGEQTIIKINYPSICSGDGSRFDNKYMMLSNYDEKQLAHLITDYLNRSDKKDK